jgi:hypothetical protein
MDPRDKRLANLRPWKPGQSGNPAGRPKVNQEIRDRAKDAAVTCFLRILAETSNEEPRIALQACKDVLKMAGVSFDSESMDEMFRLAAMKRDAERPQELTISVQKDLEKALPSPENPLN